MTTARWFLLGWLFVTGWLLHQTALLVEEGERSADLAVKAAEGWLDCETRALFGRLPYEQPEELGEERS